MRAIPPFLLETDKNPDGLPVEVFDTLRGGMAADRAQFYKDLGLMFYGANREGNTCLEAISESDLTMDLQAIDVPTLIIHGDDDQIVPIALSSNKSSKMIKANSTPTYSRS